MNISFLDKNRNVQELTIIHIIEHEGYGTLHQVIEPLQIDDEQQVICSFNLTQMKFVRESKFYVIHTTGHMYPIISNLEMLLKEKINVGVFLHVSPKYLELKRKDFLIDYLNNLQLNYPLLCFCPSNEIAKKYFELGLKVDVIQLGFPEINLNSNIENNNFRLCIYCNKYITICTSSDPRYIDLKGINEFVDLMENLNKKQESLILGFNGMYRGIRCIRLSLNDFLYVLSKSKLYIQLSKTEAYNITDLQAKRLRIPTIVSNVEGHIDCMRYESNRLFRNDEINEKIKEVSKLECIEKNYQDSIDRENLNNFINSLKKAIGGW